MVWVVWVLIEICVSLCLSLPLSVYWLVFLHAYLSLSLYLSFSLSHYVSLCLLSICWTVYLFACLSICLWMSVCLVLSLILSLCLCLSNCMSVYLCLSFKNFIHYIRLANGFIFHAWSAQSACLGLQYLTPLKTSPLCCILRLKMCGPLRLQHPHSISEQKQVQGSSLPCRGYIVVVMSLIWNFVDSINW